MTDATQTQSPTAVSTSVNQENWTKKPFFWGGQEVFENLEKFERISNPSEWDQNFDFDFTDVVPEVSEEQPSSISEDAEVPLESHTEDEELTTMENIGLENIFQPTEEIHEETQTDAEEELPTFEIDYPNLASQEEEPSLEAETPDQEVFPTEESEEEIQVPEEENVELSESEEFDNWDSENPETDFSPETPEAAFPSAQEQDQETPDALSSSPHSSEAKKELASELEIGEELETLELSTEEQAHLEMESEPKSDFSPLIKQFNALLEQSRDILNLENKIQKADLSNFEIIGNNTEKSMVNYQITQEVENDLPKLLLKKREKDFVHDEEHEYLLSLSTLEKDKNLIITINNYQLYEEEKDLQDPIKQLQVWDKLKKFSFLFSEKLSELEEQWETIEAEKEKMRAFRSIFRNF